jgi:ubiquinone/menaquinone biosynthesis C-methylase UbiE
MSRLGDLVFFRNHRTCPRWLCFLFDNRFRKLFQNPAEIMKDYVSEGDKVLDIGAGIGFFTIPIAELVGDGGCVYAADVQDKMLETIRKRAEHAHVQHRIKLHRVRADSPFLEEKVDFILAFWMVHEVPEKALFFEALYSLLKDNGKLLISEPKIHVTANQFDASVHQAEQAGFKIIDQPEIAGSMSALFSRSGANSDT